MSVLCREQGPLNRRITCISEMFENVWPRAGQYIVFKPLSPNVYLFLLILFIYFFAFLDQFEVLFILLGIFVIFKDFFFW